MKKNCVKDVLNFMDSELSSQFCARASLTSGDFNYHAIRKKLRHNCAIQGAPLIWKQKIWLAIYELLCSLTNQNACFITFFCIQLPLFCTLLRKNCTVLTQSESSNFFMYIINKVIDWLIDWRYKSLYNSLPSSAKQQPAIINVDNDSWFFVFPFGIDRCRFIFSLSTFLEPLTNRRVLDNREFRLWNINSLFTRRRPQRRRRRRCFSSLIILSTRRVLLHPAPQAHFN